MSRFWNTITREEMSRLTGKYNPFKSKDTVSSTNRNGHRDSISETKSKQQKYASTISLQSLESSDVNNCYTTGCRNSCSVTTSSSLIDLQNYQDLERTTCRRSPSLPPIVNYKDEYRYPDQETNDLHSRQSKHRYSRNSRSRRKSSEKLVEDLDGLEGETSGYASDNLDVSAIQRLHDKDQTLVLPPHDSSRMSERTWKNPYHYMDENSLPSSKKFSIVKAGEINRQRWGSVWGQDLSKDPPPPSWLERGLSRLDHNSQVLVINHDSASSPESSTTGSLVSDSNKTYLRGHNVPIDSDILQERELKRQKALEVQNAIKQQLLEREKKRIEEKERKLKEELAEEERIKKERDIEKQRLEEEQQRQREKEAAKQKKNKAMQEVLEAAERQTKEERRLQQQRRRNETDQQRNQEDSGFVDGQFDTTNDKESKETSNRRESMDLCKNRSKSAEVMKLPISQDVAIVLSARIDDPELFSKSSLKLVNLVVSPTSPRNSSENCQKNELPSSLNALLTGGFGSPIVLRTSSSSPKITQNRLLTPSKYRQSSGRDCGTQTDCEGDEFTDYTEKSRETDTKETKERKQSINNDRKDVEKSTNTDNELTIKSNNNGQRNQRQRQQVRQSIESRPRWNANRPGTRYRTQSEKDPHYQRRMRLRRRQVETSDEGSSDFRRSPSPGRRKYGITKSKSRNSIRRKSKLDNYDADASMDSLNSLVPLHTDKNGCIVIDRPNQILNNENINNTKDNTWCGENILSHLNSLRNGLVMKKKEWDLQECPITPITELY